MVTLLYATIQRVCTGQCRVNEELVHPRWSLPGSPQRPGLVRGLELDCRAGPGLEAGRETVIGCTWGSLPGIHFPG